MWNLLIGAIVDSMAEKTMADAVMGVLVKKSPKLAKIVSLIKNAKQKVSQIKKYLKFVDPNELFKMLTSMPQRLLWQFLQNQKRIYGIDFETAKDFTEFTRKQKNIVNKDYKKTMDDYLNKDNGTFVELSSSWLKRAEYNSTTEGIGTLTIMIKSDYSKNGKTYGPYIYPAFPLKTWRLMIQAKGRNGSGAGTIFWKMFLRGFIHSGLRVASYKYLFRVGGVHRIDEKYDLGNRLARQQEQIANLNTAFYKQKDRIINNKVDHVKWRTETLRKHNEMKRNVKARVQEYTTRYRGAKEAQREIKAKLDKSKKNIRTFNNVKKVFKKAKKIIKKGF